MAKQAKGTANKGRPKMKVLIIISLSLVLSIGGCIKTEKPLRWDADDSIQGESLFDIASEGFDELAEKNEVRTWTTIISTQEALERTARAQ